MPLNCSYSSENNEKIIQLNTNIIKKLSYPYFYCQLENICTFMYSFYVEIKEGLTTVDEKFTLIRLFQQFTETLKKKQQIGLALSFILQLNAIRENCLLVFYNDLLIGNILLNLDGTPVPFSIQNMEKRIRNSSEIEKISIIN